MRRGVKNGYITDLLVCATTLTQGQCRSNCFAYLARIAQNLFVRESDHCIAMRFDALLPNSIFVNLIVMDWSVNLDDQMALNARKINNKPIDCILPAKLDTKYLSIANHTPESSFCVGCFTAHLSRHRL